MSVVEPHRGSSTGMIIKHSPPLFKGKDAEKAILSLKQCLSCPFNWANLPVWIDHRNHFALIAIEKEAQSRGKKKNLIRIRLISIGAPPQSRTTD